MKICSKCKVPKERAEFHKNPSRRDGLRSDCKECVSAYKKVHYEETREEKLAYQTAYTKKNRKGVRAWQKTYREGNRGKRNDCMRRSLYGLALGDYERMLAKQGGVCAVCRGPGGKKGLGVDHDHESGKIRALLCLKCNCALGLLKDSSALAQAATDYLKQHGK